MIMRRNRHNFGLIWGQGPIKNRRRRAIAVTSSAALGSRVCLSFRGCFKLGLAFACEILKMGARFGACKTSAMSTDELRWDHVEGVGISCE